MARFSTERLSQMYKWRKQGCRNFPAASSIRPPSGKDDGNGAQEDLEIEPQRPVVDVGEVELHPAVEVDMVAAFQHPGASQAGTHAQTPPLPVFILLHFLGNGGTRSDERHVTPQDVPKLRQLVKAETAQPASHRGDAGVVADLEHRAVKLVQLVKLRAHLFGVVDHGTELVQLEAAPAQPAAGLAKKHRTGRGHPDHSRDAEQHWRERNQRYEGERDIEDTLEKESQLTIGRARQTEQ